MGVGVWMDTRLLIFRPPTVLLTGSPFDPIGSAFATVTQVRTVIEMPGMYQYLRQIVT